MPEGNPPRVYVDFHNADPSGRLRLNTAGTIEDLARQGIQLREGLVLALYSDDADETGAVDELRVTGRVEFAPDERAWVAVIDWAAVRHASEESNSSARKAAS
jgi:hypothetical protein